MVNQQFFLPMIPDSAPIVINVAQNDYDASDYPGRLIFNLVSEGSSYDMDDATAVFQGLKPDGTAFAYDANIISASVVRVPLKAQMTAIRGRVVCELILTNNDGRIGSFNIWLEVQQSAIAGATASETDIPSLVALAEGAAERAEQAAEDAAAWSANPPYIGLNEHWFVYDTDTQLYVDSGVDARGRSGNKWYRGTGISGKAVNPTVYSSSGVTNANPNDFYLNPSEGAVYYCVTGGDASTATWSYDFSMGDMLMSDYDPNGTVKTDGGIEAYVGLQTANSYSASEDLIRSTVGWTGKNAFSLTLADIKAQNISGTWSNNAYTISGATFTISTNKDGQVTEIDVDTNSSATSEQIQFILKKSNLGLKAGKAYKFNGCPSGAASGTYFLTYNSGDSPATYYSNCYESDADVVAVDESIYPYDYIAIFVRSGQSLSHKKFYPMLRDASITDNTFEPYHKSVEDTISDVYGVMGENGAKNLLENTATTQTANHVTFTVNSDGTVTANGTATADADLTINNTKTFKAGSYILNGSPSGSSGTTYYMAVSGKGRDYGSGAEITLANDEVITTFIRIASGTTVNNLVFYPMIRLASDPDDTYVPYAMTNLELTEKVFDKEIVLDGVDLNDIDETGLYYLRGKSVTNLPADITPTQLYAPMLVLKNLSNSDIRQVIYRHNGTIYLRGKSGSPATWGSWYKFTGTIVS